MARERDAPALETGALARRRTDVVALTQELVRAPSPNPPGDEREAAAVVAGYLAGLGGVTLATLAPRPERPTLVFSAGEGPGTFALAAHLDTHPATGEWGRDPFSAELANGRIHGLGTTDNKGAVAAMAVVFRAFAESGAGEQARLLFIANADEETGGRYGIEYVRDALDTKPDAVVVAEPSGIESSYERLYTAARGTSRFRVTLTGVETHSSLADHDGVANAIELLEEVVSGLRARLALLGQRHPVFGIGPRLIPVSVEGGRGWGVVPARASMHLELRVTPGFAQEQVERDVQEALAAAAAAAGTTASVEYAEGSLRWMAPSEVAAENPIVVAARSAWADVFGSPPLLGCFPGGTDARLFSERGIPTLAGVGPGALVRAHHPDEYVTVGELDAAVRLYAAIVARYFQEGGPV